MEMSSPNKRLKTLAQSPIIHPTDSKGESEIQSLTNRHENEHEPSMDCCGICLSEGVISRGFIDSCNHYFCFICIMEWAKVESRCPLCKHRFSTIRRPPKTPLFHSERLVRVPVRDQVYCHFGNATTGPPDPYTDVKCSVCHSIADEHLVLLCDLCDTASHTYCIGLGVTIPEGDWFCQDCTLLRRENLEYESTTDSHSEINIPGIPKLLLVNENVSVSDIVRESYGGVQSSRVSFSDSGYLPTPRSTNETRRPEIVANQPAKSNARTLGGCHNVRDRIRILRENWDKFRSGKLNFSTDQGVNNVQVPVSCVRGENPVSGLSQQPTFESSSLTSGSRESEIRKAWKMLDRAKLVKQGRRKSDIVHSTPKLSMRKLDGLKVANGEGSVDAGSNIHRISTKDGNVGLGHHRDCSLQKNYCKQCHLVSGKQKCETSTGKTVTSYPEVSISPSSAVYQELPPCRSVRASSDLYSDSTNEARLAVERSVERPCLISSSAKSGVSSGDHVRDNSTNKGKNPMVKSNLESSNQSKQYVVAKSEVQSLVKLNLKLQMKDEKLEADVFKEVARLATHSILAACGLEQSRPGYCTHNGSACPHPRELWQLKRSSLIMPNSCSACFYVFVKDMVTASLLQKKCKQER